MYGTVMIGTLKGTIDELRNAGEKWRAERQVPGFVSSEAMSCDDGKTVINVVKFTDKASYMALADDPAQAEWWEGTMRPLLAADPQWYDGEWES
jgi:hypothetical protein